MIPAEAKVVKFLGQLSTSGATKLSAFGSSAGTAVWALFLAYAFLNVSPTAATAIICPRLVQRCVCWGTTSCAARARGALRQIVGGDARDWDVGTSKCRGRHLSVVTSGSRERRCHTINAMAVAVGFACWKVCGAHRRLKPP